MHSYRTKQFTRNELLTAGLFSRLSSCLTEPKPDLNKRHTVEVSTTGTPLM
uniref:Uncharacterized protein n=1 Tax=Meloidogyne incognita TaxID=6306 RepID=A0A914LW49_MELIC